MDTTEIQTVIAALRPVGRLTESRLESILGLLKDLFQSGCVQSRMFFSRITFQRSHHARCPLTLTIIPQVIRLASALLYYIILQLKRGAGILLARSRMGRVGL